MKIKKDDKGVVMVSGGETFGTIVRPKCKFYNTSDLKSQASTRLLQLLKKKKNYVIKEDYSHLKFQNEFASQPVVVQFAYYRSKLKSLMIELKELQECGNSKKIKLKEPVLLMEIEEVKLEINELAKTISNEKRVISRTFTNGK